MGLNVIMYFNLLLFLNFITNLSGLFVIDRIQDFLWFFGVFLGIYFGLRFLIILLIYFLLNLYFVYLL